MKNTQKSSNELIRATIRQSLFRLYKLIHKSAKSIKSNDTKNKLSGFEYHLKTTPTNFKKFIEYINLNVMQADHEIPDILLTGQFVASWVLHDFNLNIDYNDFDIFVLDTKCDSYKRNKLGKVDFTPVSVDTLDNSKYVGLFKGYNIESSSKVLINKTMLNVIAATPQSPSTYQQNDEYHNYKTFAENIVGTFDLNVNKVGLLTNKWATVFEPIVSDEFVHFIATGQFNLTHSLNPKYLSRYFNKLVRFADAISSKKVYFDESNILSIIGLQNRINSKLSEQREDSILNYSNPANKIHRITPNNPSVYIELPHLMRTIAQLHRKNIDIKFNPMEHIKYDGDFNFKIGHESWSKRTNLLSDLILYNYYKHNSIDNSGIFDITEYNIATEYIHQFVSKAKVNEILNYLVKQKLFNYRLNTVYEFMGILIRHSKLLKYPLNKIKTLAIIYNDHNEFADFFLSQSRENIIKSIDLILELDEYIKSDDFNKYREILTENSKHTYIFNMLKKYRYLPLSVVKLELLAWVEDDYEYQTIPLVNHDRIELDVELNEQKLKITELITTIELTREGELMKHCVGGYSNALKRGTTLIFNITSNEDSTLRYTFELRLNEQDKSVDLVQVRGKSNKDVEKHHSKIVNHGIDLIMQKVSNDVTYFIKLNKMQEKSVRVMQALAEGIDCLI